MRAMTCENGSKQGLVPQKPRDILSEPPDSSGVISNLMRNHIPKPVIGGRAAFFLSIRPVLVIDFPASEALRKITITASRYPEKEETDPKYILADSSFPTRALLVYNREISFQNLDNAQEAKRTTND